MNEKLDSTLQSILEKALLVAEKTGEFTIEQAPLLLEEFYKWHLATHVLGVLLGLLFMIIFFVAYKKTMKWQDNFLETPLPFFCCAAILAGIIILCKNTYYLVFISVAPKLYLIEYFIK